MLNEFEPNSNFKSPLYKFAAVGASVGCLTVSVSPAVASNAIQEVKMLAEKKGPLGSMVSIREKGVVQRNLEWLKR